MGTESGQQHRGRGRDGRWYLRGTESGRWVLGLDGGQGLRGTNSGWWALVPWEGRGQGLRGTEVLYGKVESSGDRQRGRLHHSVNALSAPELCI